MDGLVELYILKTSEMELELGLALPNNKPELGFRGEAQPCRKRSFDEGFGEIMMTTLPLFVWKGGDGGDDDVHLVNKSDEWSSTGRELVGWPPVKCRRWRDGRGSAVCVKVKMEGVGIGRKVDLSLHHCYESLLHALSDMFFPYHHNEGGVGLHGHRVTYEDGEGDWLLVGDVPWEVFFQSVKSIKILARSAD